MRNNLVNFFKKWSYEGFIFIFFLLHGLRITSGRFQIAYWPYSFYLLSYDIGHGSRLLIGTIFNLIFHNFIPFKIATELVLTFTVMVCLLISILLGKLLKLADKKAESAGICFLVLLYLALPMKFSAYFSNVMLGYFETYIFPIVIAIIYLFIAKKQNWGFWILVSILCFICMAIHQVFLFILFPLILSTMIYNLRENNGGRKTILGTILVCAVVAISFIYFQFFSKLNFKTLSELVTFVSQRTDVIFNPSFIIQPYNCEYYSSTYQKLIGTMIYAFKNLLNPVVIPSAIIFLTPVFIIIKRIWNGIYANCQNENEKKTYKLMQACTLLFIPAFALACDWGRWTLWLVTYQFAIVFVLYRWNSKPLIKSMQEFSEFVKTNKFMLGLFLIFAMLIKFDLFNIVR